jgi:prepilin-type N-terminal cleavage/methylation domain-containing protein
MVRMHGLMESWMGRPCDAGRAAGKRSSGYTFLEMMMVVIIIGVVGAFVMPNGIAYVRSMQLKGAANTVKRQLQLARMKALADTYKHCGVRFKMAPPDSQWTQIFLDVGTVNNKFDAGDVPYLKPQDMPKGITMMMVTKDDDADSTIIFRGDGSAKYTAAMAITDGRDTFTISVLASTGRIRFHH